MGKGARRDGREDTGSSASDGETAISAPICSKFGFRLRSAVWFFQRAYKFSVVEYVIIHVNLDASIAGFMFVDCEDDKVVSSP